MKSRTNNTSASRFEVLAASHRETPESSASFLSAKGGSHGCHQVTQAKAAARKAEPLMRLVIAIGNPSETYLIWQGPLYLNESK